MKIFENPFYILGATPLDNRRKINVLADIKSLFTNAAKVSEARDILINPPKRLAAELRWFPGLNKDQTSELLFFFSELQAGNRSDEPNIFGLRNLAELNYKIYTLPYREINDIYIAKYLILEISRLYESINIKDLTDEINHDREIGGFPSVSGTEEVEEAIRDYRDDIKKTISQILLKLTQAQYIELTTLLAQKFVALDDHYTGSTIIDDILSEYALNIAAEMQTQKQQIINRVNNIRENIEVIGLDKELKNLQKLVGEWDKLAQPLQLVAQGKGQHHSDSEELAYILRGLAIDLHNNHGKTAEALMLISALKSVFAELPEFTEYVGNDEDTLKKIEAKQKAEKQDEQESILRNRADIQYSVTLFTDKIFVPPFCTCCMKQTDITETVSTSTSQEAWGKKTTRTVSMNMPICPDCLEHRKRAKSKKWLIIILSLIITAISVPIFARVFDVNEDRFWGLPLTVALVTYFLLGLIIKLPALGEEHSVMQQSVWLSGIEMSGNMATFTFTNWRYAKLFAAANASNFTESTRRNRAKSRSYIKAIDHPVGVCFLTLALTGIMLLVFGNTLLSSLDMLPGSSVKISSNYSNPSSTGESSTNYPSTSIKTKQQRLNAIEADLNKRLEEIKDMEDKLKGLADDIDYYESQYNLTINNYYASSYNDAVNEYIDLYDKYDQAINEYNDLVAEYNTLIQSSASANSWANPQNSASSKTNSSSSVALKNNSTNATTPKTDPKSLSTQKGNSTNPAAPKTDSQSPSTQKGNLQEIHSRQGTFTIGSSEAAVKSVMGDPDSIIGDTWSYGLSSVYFRNGFVTGWSIIDKNLNVYMGDKISSAIFKVGSSKEDVVKAMGTPSGIIGDTWSYGLSSVYFRNGLVTGWSIIDKNLNVYMGDKISSATFKVGSSKEDVVKAMGTPSGIIGDKWSYGLSSVYFRNGFVTGWSIIDKNLNVYMGDKISSATFKVGSSKEDVVKAMGTPSGIIGDKWSYGLSSVYFRNGLVTGWSIIDKNLNVYMGDKISSATFKVGSSKEDVVKAMGTPSGIIGDTWSYGLSSVYFRNGLVTSWSEIDVKLNVK